MNDKYLHYEIEDFISDDGFVDYVTQGENTAQWETWLKAHPDAADRVAEAKKLISGIRFQEENFAKKEAVWQRIDQSTKAQQLDTKRSKYWIWGAMAAAACIALLLLARPGTTSDDSWQIHHNQETLAQNISLPDASYADLSTGSTLEYDRDSWEHERRIKLSGEARFEVEKGAPFIVSTDNGRVEVLGTNFTVNSEADGFTVHVYRGKVKVTVGSHSEILTAGMSYAKNAPMPSYAEAGSSAVRFYQFEDQTLGDIIPSIEREYDVTIEAEATLREIRYTGFFESGDLETALKKVCWPLNLQYQIDSNKVYLSTDQ